MFKNKVTISGNEAINGVVCQSKIKGDGRNRGWFVMTFLSMNYLKYTIPIVNRILLEELM
jgi:hypothetical protein